MPEKLVPATMRYYLTNTRAFTPQLNQLQWDLVAGTANLLPMRHIFGVLGTAVAALEEKYPQAV
jgi:hypothetical protein